MPESKSPVSLDIKLDLNDPINRVGEHVFDILTESAVVQMPQPACAYPGGVSQAEIEHIYGHAYKLENYHLSFRMSEDSNWPMDQMDYELRCDWQGLWFANGSLVYACLENVIPKVNITDTGWGWSLSVSCQFGKPVFRGDIELNDTPFDPRDDYKYSGAELPLTYHIVAKDGDGDLHRMVDRQFIIHADGDKTQKMF